MGKKKFLIFVLTFLLMPSTCMAESLEGKLSGYCKNLSQNGTVNFKDSEKVLFDGSGYEANCVYVVEDSFYCDVFQLSFNKDGNFKSDYYSNRESTFDHFYIVNPSKEELTEDFISDFNGRCMTVSKENVVTGGMVPHNNYYLEVGAVSGGTIMTNIYRRNASTSSIIIKDPDATRFSCKDLLGEKGSSFLKTIVNLFFLAIPIILIVLGSIDFAKAVFAGGEDEMKKAQSKFIKRILLGAAIFLVPSIISILLNFAHSIWPDVWGKADDILCGIFD